MKKLLLMVLVMAIFTGCAAWNDNMKDYESDTKGLNRKVEVYSSDGKLLKTYEGLIRVRDQDGKHSISLNLIYDNNRRVIIDNAVVIIEEIR